MNTTNSAFALTAGGRRGLLYPSRRHKPGDTLAVTDGCRRRVVWPQASRRARCRPKVRRLCFRPTHTNAHACGSRLNDRLACHLRPARRWLLDQGFRPRDPGSGAASVTFWEVRRSGSIRVGGPSTTDRDARPTVRVLRRYPASSLVFRVWQPPRRSVSPRRTPRLGETRLRRCGRCGYGQEISNCCRYNTSARRLAEAGVDPPDPTKIGCRPAEPLVERLLALSCVPLLRQPLLSEVRPERCYVPVFGRDPTAAFTFPGRKPPRRS